MHPPSRADTAQAELERRGAPRHRRSVDGVEPPQASSHGAALADSTVVEGTSVYGIAASALAGLYRDQPRPAICVSRIGFTPRARVTWWAFF